MTGWLANPYFLGGLDPGRLELILFATEKCNFRCAYCYEDFALGKMAPQVVDGVCSLISKRSSTMHTLAISWFGGEPLMAQDVVSRVMLHAQSASQRDDAFKVVSSMTTNGWYLTPEVLRAQVALGVHDYQVSLDGAAQDHDRTRKHLSGKGTFHRIWSNLMAAAATELDFRMLLRIHVHPANESAAALFVHTLNEAFASDTRFKVMFQAVEDLTPANPVEVFPEDEAGAVIDRLQELTLPAIRHEDPFADQYVCYASRPNSFCIRSDGRVAKCTVAVHDTRNDVGHIDAHGNLHLSAAAHRRWYRAYGTEDAAALACPYSVMKFEDRTLLDKFDRHSAADADAL